MRVRFEPASNRIDGDLRGGFIWKAKNTRRDAAECQAANTGDFGGSLKTGGVTTGKHVGIRGVIGRGFIDWANRVQNKVGWQMVGAGDFGAAAYFGADILLLFLFVHNVRAVIAQARPGGGMDHIVNALVKRLKATQHLIVRSIHNRIGLERANISLPE